MARSRKKPNILLCLCDQLRAFEVGCYGHPHIRTPHLDRLAAEGARFETAVSNNPVCMPARSIVLSGQHSRTCCRGQLGNTALHPREGGSAIMPQYPRGDRLHLPEQTLPEALHAAGYHAAAVGKWHIEAWPDKVGFDHYVIPRVHHCYSAQAYVEDGGGEFAPPGWSVDYEVGRVERYLDARQRDGRPFFLFYNVSPPHMPLADAPEKYLSMYSEADAVIRPNVDLSAPVRRQDWEFRTYLWDFRYYRDGLPCTRLLPEGFNLRRLTAMYMGLTSWVDDAVGAALAALDRTDLARDTLVVFASDHGDNLGSFGRMGKSTLNEESIRVPLLVRGPGVTGGRVLRQVASLVDLAPTLCELAGLDRPPHWQGRSLAPVLRGERDSLDADYAFIETSGDGCGLRTATHLLGLPRQADRSLGARPHYFHDLRADPCELRNLAGSGEQADVAAGLERLLRDLDGRIPWGQARPGL